MMLEYGTYAYHIKSLRRKDVDGFLACDIRANGEGYLENQI